MYYAIMDLPKDPGFLVKLFYDGEPLTEEQMRQAEFSVEADGMPLKWERDPGESQYRVYIDPDAEQKAGFHTVTARVSGLKDRMQNELSAEKKQLIELGTIPGWLRLLIILGAILLLIAIIVFILTRPALPKKIAVTNVRVTVNGQQQKISFLPDYPKHGNKRDFGVSGKIGSGKEGFKVTVVPAKGSYLITPSSKRKAEVIADSVQRKGGVNNLFLNRKFILNDKNKLISAVPAKSNFSLPKKFTFSGTKVINGKPASYSVSGDLKFGK